jgi:type I restriction enzyme, S subunit
MIEGLRPYPDVRPTELPWLGDIPSHWEVRRNGCLFAPRRETGFPELPILEVSIGRGVRVRDLGDGGRKQQMTDRAKYQRAAPGDLAYNMMRMWQGAVGVAPADGLVSPAYVVARPYPETSSAYYAYLFRTAAYMREVDVFSRGIVPDRNRLYWESFKQIPSPYPPLEEQRLIVRFLDWHGVQTAKLVRAKQNALRLAAEQRDVLTHEVISAAGTQLMRLDVVTDLILRPVVRDSAETYTRVGLFNRGRGIFHKPLTRGDDLGDSSFFWIEDGDLILSGQFAWEGAIALAGPGEDGCVASHRYHILRGKEGILQTVYLASFLRTELGQLMLDEHSRGAAGRNKPLNIRSLRKEKVPIPLQSQQARLVEIVTLEKQLASSIARFTENLREFRARLIADVVAGVLDVREVAASLPEQIDSSELLESEGEVDEFEDSASEDFEPEEAAA